MSRGSHGTLLIDEVERFKDSVRRAALAIVDAVIRQELQHRLETMRKSLVPRAPRTPDATRAAVHQGKSRRAAAPEEPTLQAPTIQMIGGAEAQRKRVWTREAIVNELAAWLASGTTIDAAFVTRYGPPGLVAATRKTFGRFDAALNVASLQVAKLYPEGPPSRRSALDVG